MLSKCVNCGFFVKLTDEFCFDCGIKNPISQRAKRELNFARIGLITAVFYVLMLIAIGMNNPSNDGLFFAGALAFFAGLIIELGINEWQMRKQEDADKERKTEGSLKGAEIIVESRILELSSRVDNIDGVLGRIRETDGKNLLEVRRKLISGREMVTSQFARYELQKQKIELVRLQNSVSPYLFRLHRLNEFETEDGLVEIETAQAKIYKIRESLTRHDAIDFPARTQSEKNAFLQQLLDTENSCDNLREALLSRQAARALRDISPISDNLRIPASQALTHESEVFNIQTTLTDFSESFEELEREYRRLKAEEKTAQNLLTE